MSVPLFHRFLHQLKITVDLLLPRKKTRNLNRPGIPFNSVFFLILILVISFILLRNKDFMASLRLTLLLI